MAEDSLFWDGTTTGHAASTDIWSAPYSSAEMSDLLSTLFGSDAARGYVIPGFGNDLKIQANSPTGMSVIVKSGRVALRGRLYGNTADNVLTISAADPTNHRLDRIVARISFAAQTITLAVLTGTAAATPSLPSLTQNSTTYEISLGYVFVVAAVTAISELHIHDERVFAPNFESLLNTLSQTNLLGNSEFMAFSKLSSGTTAGAPDMWDIVDTVTTWASATKPSQMSRGRAVTITAGAANAGMSQTIRVRASTLYALKVLVNVTAGDVGRIEVTTNSASPATVQKNIRRTGAWIEYLVYYTTESDATTLTLKLLCLNNTDIVSYGQALINEGYSAGPFRQVHETIQLNAAITDSNWDNDTKSSGDTTIDMDSDFQALILPGTRSIRLMVWLEDSDAAGATAIFRTVVSTSTIGMVDSQHLTAAGATMRDEVNVPIDVNGQFIITMNASGVGTASISIRIVGMDV